MEAVKKHPDCEANENGCLLTLGNHAACRQECVEHIAAIMTPRQSSIAPIGARCAFGHGTDQEERMIGAASNYITRTMGHYPTGDRRFAIGLFNAMLAAVTK